MISPVPASMCENPASRFASLLLAGLRMAGLRRIVVCPGSRSQAVALAADAFAEEGLLELSVRADERSAGFLALGMVRASGFPVAVVTTSGSAIGHLVPAVMEAAHEGLPLVLLTCDRPEELLGIGANQATAQDQVFGVFAECRTLQPDESRAGAQADARAAVEAARALSGRRRPLQLNIRFRDPLSGVAPTPVAAVERIATYARERGIRFPEVPQAEASAVQIPAVSGVLAIAGDRAPDDTAQLCADAGIPLCAEIVSGQRRGPAAVPSPEAVLRGPLAEEVREVVVFGRPTLNRTVPAFLRRPGLRITVVEIPGAREPFRPAPSATLVSGVRFGGRADPDWLARWMRAGQASAGSGSELDSSESRGLVEAVWRATGSEDSIVFAASSLVRVADRVLSPAPHRVFANRGLAGIDGTLSTAIGIAAARPAGVVRVVVGDLAFLHDAGGLWLPAAEHLPRVQVVVGDDRGGAIFNRLEVAQTAAPGPFSRVMRVPHGADLTAIAAGYGWPARDLSVAELRGALAAGTPGVWVIRLPEGPAPRP
ncbi:MAG: 2-succinyl-5-enolpyruvyl-6-hydroxy-3-cyclohexene-1-carboxylic-acid synthase [Microbacteriaceae bacterium]|nr:2-succinyl-5-enolpyruvyl-6-hydroxy-3-cyclohexene-1-carboxylic-acid synthase [Microbacteriaceae bacterium]MCI1206863.1 2-succinyl-5-enolpyruvyl-6-hydroxy-3-cyclohexene-1-carboxylic-acid synthase [Microbacteriaceae bacterium]